MTVRVAIANDTMIALEALRRAIATDPAYHLIWTASDGAQAIEKAQQDTPDLMLMDLLMPEVDGVEATRQIMARSPCAILIVTASVHRNTSRVFEAMGCGALDVVKTPALGRAFGRSGSNSQATQLLLTKMATMSAYLGKSRRSKAIRKQPLAIDRSVCLPELVVIGASTGGPKALAQILSQLSAKSNRAVVVVQHIDTQFAAGLASWLNDQTKMSVRLAKSGDRPTAGTVLMAGEKGHLVMQSDRTLTYTTAFTNTVYQPSVDIFFASVAQHWPLNRSDHQTTVKSKGQAVLLTGMGRDGARGLRTLRAAGWETIAESETTCVVYGMPRAAVEIGAASQVLRLDQISKALESC